MSTPITPSGPVSLGAVRALFDASGNISGEALGDIPASKLPGELRVGEAVTTLSTRRSGPLSAEESVSVWRTRSTNDNGWGHIVWAPELEIFAALALIGENNNAMTSTDGINWVTRSTVNARWRGSAWAPELGLFAAVSQSGDATFMTSADGEIWTSRTASPAVALSYIAITWANSVSGGAGLFAAVSNGGPVATSPNGVDWTTRAVPQNRLWRDITWAQSLNRFVAVGEGGDSNRVMTSDNGIAWVSRSTGNDNQWRSVVWAPELGLFAAVAGSGTGNRVMTSPDGIAWTTRTSAADNSWFRITWAPEPGLFAAVANTGTGNRVMTSPDGVSWQTRASAADNMWVGIAWSGSLELFACVADLDRNGKSSGVMTSRLEGEPLPMLTFEDPDIVTVRRHVVLSGESELRLGADRSEKVRVTGSGVSVGKAGGAVAALDVRDGLAVTEEYDNATERAVSTWISQRTNDNAWNGIAWAPELGLFAAVSGDGTGNRVMTSPDGKSWQSRVSAANNLWNRIVWSPELGLFAAVAFTGTGNRVMTSPNGIVWTTRATNDNLWYDVAWGAGVGGGAGRFVAIAVSGTGNRVMTSDNGVTWTTQVTLVDNAWRGIAWGSGVGGTGLFVVVASSGTGNRVMTSPNGTTWTTQVSAADNDWFGVAYSQQLGLFAAVAWTGSQNRVMTSPDGITWSTRATPVNNAWYSIAWAAELGCFAAVSYTGAGDRVMTSSDGISWKSRSSFNNSYNQIAWSPSLGIFATVSFSGSGNRVMTSLSPLESTSRSVSLVGGSAAQGTWTAGAAAGSGQFKIGWRGSVDQNLSRGGDFGAGLLIDQLGVVGGARRLTLGTTADGVTATPERAVSTWRTRASAADNNWRGVTWSPERGLFVAVSIMNSGNNNAMTSSDGVHWLIRSTNNNSWQDVTWAAEIGLFVAVAYTGTGNRVMTSPDGITWTTRASAADNQWVGIAWAPELGLFAAVAFAGTGNRVMTSSNGITWTTRTTNDNNWVGIAWAPELGLFAAVAQSGSGNRVMTSPDGITWTTRASAADNGWMSIAWAPELGLFAAVAQSGSGNRVMTSPDGITWTTRASAADSQWVDIAWAPELGLFAAVSVSALMTSTDGISWTTRPFVTGNAWQSIAWAPQLHMFAAVAGTGTGNRVMTSLLPSDPQPLLTLDDAGSGAAYVSGGDGTGVKSLSLNPGVGNVGIGITNPSRTLVVGRENNRGELAVVTRQTATSNGAGLLISATTSNSAPRTEFYYNATGRTDAAASWAGTPAMTILSANGNVGIGTNDPQRRLHVRGNTLLGTSEGIVTFPYEVAIRGPPGNHLVFNEPGISAWGIEISGGLFSFVNLGSSPLSNRMVITPSAQVGIGTTNPSQRLHVEGSIFITGSYLPSSDDRLKLEESHIEEALPTILKLRPQLYRKVPGLEDSSGGFIESGLIAQEVYYDAPELRHLVSIPEDASGIEVPPPGYGESSDPNVDPDYSNWGSTPAALNYIGLIPYLIRAVQEQQAEINALKAQLSAGSA